MTVGDGSNMKISC